MRYIIFIIALLIPISGMVIGKKIINGERRYHEIAALHANLGFEGDRLFLEERDLEWSYLYDKSPTTQAMIQAVSEKRKAVHKKQMAYNSELKKLEPLHDTYEQIITAMVVTSFFGLFAFVIFWFFRSWQRTKKYYANLIKEGKMTQAEYDELLKSSRSFNNGNSNDRAASDAILGCGRGWTSDDDFVRRRENNYTSSSSSRWDY